MRKFYFTLLVLVSYAVNSQVSIDSLGNRVVPDRTVIYPKCKGDNEALKKCFTKSIHKHLFRKLRLKSSRKSKLTDPTKKMFFVFEINKEGAPVNFKIKAPSKRLEKEGYRVLKLLPKMKPAEYKGKPVITKYVMPLSIGIHFK